MSESIWNQQPQGAQWYGEVIFESREGETDYNYAFSSQEEEPDEDSVDVLAPEGAEILERTVKPTSQNPQWVPEPEDD